MVIMVRSKYLVFDDMVGIKVIFQKAFVLHGRLYDHCDMYEKKSWRGLLVIKAVVMIAKDNYFTRMYEKESNQLKAWWTDKIIKRTSKNSQ